MALSLILGAPVWAGAAHAQESTREGLLVSLKEVLQEALEMNRAEARAAAGSSYEELALAL
jgi:hypothetical protein